MVKCIIPLWFDNFIRMGKNRWQGGCKYCTIAHAASAPWRKLVQWKNRIMGYWSKRESGWMWRPECREMKLYTDRSKWRVFSNGHPVEGGLSNKHQNIWIEIVKGMFEVLQTEGVQWHVTIFLFFSVNYCNTSPL